MLLLCVHAVHLLLMMDALGAAGSILQGSCNCSIQGWHKQSHSPNSWCKS